MRQQADQECGGSLGKNLFPFAIFDPTCRSRDPRSEVKGHDLYELLRTPGEPFFAIQKMDAHFQEAGKCVLCISFLRLFLLRPNFFFYYF